MFKFFDVNYMTDYEIELINEYKNPENKSKGYTPSYGYLIREYGKERIIGKIDLRVGNNINIFYGGHIGYFIDKNYRGNGYAYKACLLLFQLAKRHGMGKLYITCNPDNYPSQRTCEKAGGQLIEIVDLPKNTELYQLGARQKCRYEFNL